MPHARSIRSRLLPLLAAWLLAAPAVARSATPPAAAPTESPASAAPRDFRSLDAWLDYQRTARIAALPLEARVYFRRALIAHDANAPDEALRLARGAIALDPSFLLARWTALRWSAFRDPTQALAQLDALVAFTRGDFPTQWSIALNAAWLALTTWALALLALGLLLLVVHHALLHHALVERLRAGAGLASATVWAWALLVAPFALGLGLLLPTAALLGLLWPSLKARERAVVLAFALTFAALPFAAPLFDRAALPMRTETSPLAAVAGWEREPASDARLAEIARLAADHPGDPYLDFARGWFAYRTGDFGTAAATWQRVATAWPTDARVLDDWGAALAQLGRHDDAMRRYQQALGVDGRDATAWFNLSQAYVQSYDFDQANRALSRASALDFDRVQGYKNQPARAGSLAPVAEWLAPARLWGGVRAARAADDAPPPRWQRWFHVDSPSGWGVLVAFAVGLVIGWWFHRGLPLNRCRNCDRVVCRRCAERRRAQILCTPCGRVAASASSPEFSRMLLTRERARRERWSHGGRMVLTVLVPGAGLLYHRRVWRALVLLLVGASLVVARWGGPWPYAAAPRFGTSLALGALPMVVTALVLAALGFLGALAESQRARRRAADASTVGRRRGSGVRLAETPPPPDREAA